MKILKRHISQNVLKASLVMLFGIVGLEAFILLGREFGYLNAHYTIKYALIFILYALPGEVYQLFPVAMLMGSLIGLGRLASDHELTVMRNAGMSLWQILGAVFRAGIFLLIIAIVIGEVVAPHATHQAEKYRSMAKSGGRALTTSYGTWIANGNNYIHVNKILENNKMEGVTMYEFDDHHRLKRVNYAKDGVFHDHMWEFENVYQSDIGIDTVKTKYLKTMHWKVKIDPHWVGIEADPHEMSLPRLIQLVLHRHSAGLAADEYDLVLWQRVFRPLTVLLMIFLGIPFIFGPLRTVTMGYRVMLGILCGFGFFMLNQFLGPLSLVYQMPPIIGAALPMMLFFLFGLYLLRRAR